MALVGGRYMGDAKLLVPTRDVQTLNMLNDKLELVELVVEIGLDKETPRISELEDMDMFHKKLDYFKRMNDDWDNKIVVKPRVQTGSRGMRIIDLLPDRTNDYENFINKKPSECTTISLELFEKMVGNNKFDNLFMEEYIEGSEYTVDCVCYQGKTLAIVPRERVETIGGISKVAVVEDAVYERIKYVCDWIISEYKLSYNIGFQFIVRKNGTPVIIECNPRLQGSSLLSEAAGVDVIDMALRLAKGEEVEEIAEDEIKWGTTMYRTFKEEFK